MRPSVLRISLKTVHFGTSELEDLENEDTFKVIWWGRGHGAEPHQIKWGFWNKHGFWNQTWLPTNSKVRYVYLTPARLWIALTTIATVVHCGISWAYRIQNSALFCEWGVSSISYSLMDTKRERESKRERCLVSISWREDRCPLIQN